MARMPGTVWAGEQSPRRPMVRYDIVCVHTIVGYAPAHAAHFSVRADGTIIQSRDTAYQSAANLDGNPRVISIENEDHGPAFGGTPRLPGWVPLTDAQVHANARILAWVHETHGVPLQLCPDSRPGSRGLGYHRQGIDGNFAGYEFPGRVPGGEVWTSAYGKVCPTDARIAQLPNILAIARQEDDPMTEYADQLQRIEDKLDRYTKTDADRARAEYGREKADRGVLEDVAARTARLEAALADADDDDLDRLRGRVRRLRGEVVDLRAVVETLTVAGSDDV